MNCFLYLLPCFIFNLKLQPFFYDFSSTIYSLSLGLPFSFDHGKEDDEEENGEISFSNEITETKSQLVELLAECEEKAEEVEEEDLMNFGEEEEEEAAAATTQVELLLTLRRMDASRVKKMKKRKAKEDEESGEVNAET